MITLTCRMSYAPAQMTSCFAAFSVDVYVIHEPSHPCQCSAGMMYPTFIAMRACQKILLAAARSLHATSVKRTP